jgi:hypothetical protein
MNKFLKLSVAGALALGYATAHAQIGQPSGGSSDLILFANILSSSGTVVASYAGDTGVSINSLLPTGSLAAANTTVPATGLTTLSLGSIDVPADANLKSFLALDGTGDVVEWAIQAGQYTGGTTNSNFNAVGNAKFITTAPSANVITNKTTGNMIHWASIDGAVTTINSNIASQAGNPSTTSVFGAATASAGVWDATAVGNALGNWYGNGPVTYQGVPTDQLNTFQNLYGVTGDANSSGKLQVYSLGTLELTSAGTLESPTLPTPIPAAVWLFGSGLLGLIGVGRRKAAQV